MDLEARKNDFVQEFLKFQKEEIIKKFEVFLNKIKEYDELTGEEDVKALRARIERSLDDFEHGRVISNDELMEEYKQWS